MEDEIETWDQMIAERDGERKWETNVDLNKDQEKKRMCLEAWQRVIKISNDRNPQREYNEENLAIGKVLDFWSCWMIWQWQKMIYGMTNNWHRKKTKWAKVAELSIKKFWGKVMDPDTNGWGIDETV
jgi:hypothetical protein